MNILGLVFSLLLILSYGFYASWDKHQSTHRLCTSYLHHEKASRKLHNSYQSTVYKNLQGKSIEPTKKNPPHGKAGKQKKSMNRCECAKINLHPLIQEGKTAHPELYELTAKLLRTFYPKFTVGKRFEYRMLDAILNASKSGLPLEKLDLGKFRKIYYKMLKGTKGWDFAQKIGHPSLLDFVKIEESSKKLCLFHAPPELLGICFHFKIAEALYEEIHKENAPLLTKELIERVANESHLFSFDEKLFTLFELGKPEHKEYQKTIVAQENGISIRQKVFFE